MRQYTTPYGVPGLTGRQQVMLLALTNFAREHGRAPTIRELGDVVGISSTNGVTDHLKALERKGYIERGDHQHRALVALRDIHGKPLVSEAEQIAQLRARVAELEAQLAEATRATRAA
jgi:SOS-response transcriptional repressor LexA